MKVILIILSLLFALTGCSKQKIELDRTFYMISAKQCDDLYVAEYASKIIYVNGGGNYIFEMPNGFYVSIACFQNEADAKIVCQKLKLNNKPTEIVSISFDTINLTNSNDIKHKDLIKKNLLTFFDLIVFLEELANGLDNSTYTQEKGKYLITLKNKELKELYATNVKENFSSQHFMPYERVLSFAIMDLQHKSVNLLLSSEVRNLQLCLLDGVGKICSQY